LGWSGFALFTRAVPAILLTLLLHGSLGISWTFSVVLASLLTAVLWRILERIRLILSLVFLFQMAFHRIKMLRNWAIPELLNVLFDLWPEGNAEFTALLTRCRVDATSPVLGRAEMRQVLRQLEARRAMGRSEPYPLAPVASGQQKIAC